MATVTTIEGRLAAVEEAIEELKRKVEPRAINISRGLILPTRNVGDFGKVPGLMTEDWTS